ncbi:MAG: hypothetical protein U0172_11805 [Nitrospiraceae bacterium]
MSTSCDLFTLSVPLRDLESEPACLALFKRAPMFVVDPTGTNAQAVFPHLSQFSAEVRELVTALAAHPFGTVEANGQRVDDMQALLAMLQCYGTSVAWGDPTSFCRAMRTTSGAQMPLVHEADGGVCPFGGPVDDGADACAPDDAGGDRTAQARKVLTTVTVCPNATGRLSRGLSPVDGGGA